MKNTIQLTAITLTAVFGFNAAFADGTNSVPNAGKLPPPSTKQGVTYAADIKPIFDNSCVKCHSGLLAKRNLRLDTLEGTLKGSKNGKVIIIGDSAKSPLVLNVAHLNEDEDQWMPPLHNKAKIGPLTPEQIGLIRAWIDQGAK